jgi:hypothetical protein
MNFHRTRHKYDADKRAGRNAGSRHPSDALTPFKHRQYNAGDDGRMLSFVRLCPVRADKMKSITGCGVMAREAVP